MSRLPSNIIYNTIGQTALLVLGLLSVKFVFVRIGSDALGIIYFSLALNTALGAVLGMGICETLVREVAAPSIDEPAYVCRLIRTSSSFYWGFYFIVVLGLYWCSPFLVSKWVHLKSLQPAIATSSIRILGLGSFMALPQSLYSAVLRGKERMDLDNTIKVSATALQQFGAIGVATTGGTLLDLVSWFTLCYALGTLAYLVVCGRLLSWTAMVPALSRNVIAHNFSFSWRMASISLLAMIHTQADKLVISKLLPIGLLGYYSVASSASYRAKLVTDAVSQAAFPHFSTSWKEFNEEKLLRQYHKLQDLVCYATLPLFAAMPFAARPLFSFLFNSDAANILLPTVTFISVGLYLNSTLAIPYVFSLSVGKPEIAARSNFYALFSALPLTIALVKFFGLPGAGLSWVIYHLFAYLWQVPPTCSQCLGFPARSWFSRICKVGGLGFMVYAAAWIIGQQFRTYEIMRLTVCYVTASVIYYTVAFRVIGDELRTTMLRMLRRTPVGRPLATPLTRVGMWDTEV